MIALIISILMSAGLLSSPSNFDVHNMNAAQKTELQKSNIIEDDIDGF